MIDLMEMAVEIQKKFEAAAREMQDWADMGQSILKDPVFMVGTPMEQLCPLSSMSKCPETVEKHGNLCLGARWPCLCTNPLLCIRLRMAYAFGFCDAIVRGAAPSQTLSNAALASLQWVDEAVKTVLGR